MKKLLSIAGVIITLLSTNSYADPMGLSNYMVREQTADGSTWVDRRLTNHEVAGLRAVGEILPDGSIKQHSDAGYGGGSQLTYTPSQANNKTTVKPQSKSRKIVKKPLPTKHEIATVTKTKPSGHAQSKGTIHVRPTNFPDNPTEKDIVRMQQHIQHIERTVGKALDLSLSAYAVAELPQATEGRSGVSFGFAANDGKTAEAVGYSSNFGDKHEYTVKISLSHSGHEDAVGGGFGWQW